MEYIGKLYGHLGGKRYFDTGKTAEDWDNLEKQIAQLKAENEELKKPSSELFFLDFSLVIKALQMEVDTIEKHFDGHLLDDSVPAIDSGLAIRRKKYQDTIELIKELESQIAQE
jgi:hypothetical protein